MKTLPRGTGPLLVSLSGRRLLEAPLLNKDLAFTREERREFRLEGILPHAQLGLDSQVELELMKLRQKETDLEKFIGLAALQDRNEILFYRVLAQELEELLPIVYTPTVGQACLDYSHIMRRPRGIWITPDMQGHMPRILRRRESDLVRLIVVTDNERILGFGDLGVGGMGIPIGKLALYTAAAGIRPWECLPVSLDVGTNNERLLKDRHYAGYCKPRLRGQAYEEFMETFIQAVKEVFPRAILQFEDFHKNTALELLERYREKLPCFNDDIQGTGAAALAGMLSATRIWGRPLAEQRICYLGAGAAGVGIARTVKAELKAQGLRGQELLESQLLLDSQGLIHVGRSDLSSYKQEFALNAAGLSRFGFQEGQPHDLLDVVRHFKPTILLGTTAHAGVFGEEVLREMARHVERPLIMPYSNPTSKTEVLPVDALRWTKGRALLATGSPFPPVSYEGQSISISQGNNVYIFPGLGLGALVARLDTIPDMLFLTAARTLSKCVPQERLQRGLLYPDLREMRQISRTIALAILAEAEHLGLGRPGPALEWEERVDEAMWWPAYRKLVRV